MEACCVLDITLQADTTCADLTQVMGATAGLASQEQQHAWGCHQTPGAEQVPEEEDGGGGTSCCTEPHACSSSGGCPSPSWRCQQKAWTSLLHLSPSASQAAVSETGMDFRVYPASAYVPESNCVGFVFLSS